MDLNLESIDRLAATCAQKSPEDIVREAVSRVSNLTLACSFGAEDMVLLDIVAKVKPELPIFYLDTDVLFSETYALRDLVEERYRPVLIRVESAFSLAEQEQKYGPELWKRRPDVCCDLRKVQPLAKFLAGYAGWITGIRRDQAPTRADSQVFEWDGKFNMVKVNPLAFWSTDDVWDYIRTHDVPYNPLHDQGFPSIGCMHCTRPVAPGEDPRSGRWAGFDKTECGLHR